MFGFWHWAPCRADRSAQLCCCFSPTANAQQYSPFGLWVGLQRKSLSILSALWLCERGRYTLLIAFFLAALLQKNYIEKKTPLTPLALSRIPILSAPLDCCDSALLEYGLQNSASLHFSLGSFQSNAGTEKRIAAPRLCK
jgi:hypothetical protein